MVCDHKTIGDFLTAQGDHITFAFMIVGVTLALALSEFRRRRS